MIDNISTTVDFVMHSLRHTMWRRLVKATERSRASTAARYGDGDGDGDGEQNQNDVHPLQFPLQRESGGL